MAYFGRAAPETVLEPIGTKKKIRDRGAEVWEANGVKVWNGITVGEYGKMVMESIYGKNRG